MLVKSRWNLKNFLQQGSQGHKTLTDNLGDSSIKNPYTKNGGSEKPICQVYQKISRSAQSCFVL